MTEFKSADGRIVYEAADGTISRTAAAAHTADVKQFAVEAGERLLASYAVPVGNALQRLAEAGVTPGLLKRSYRKVFKAARLAKDAQANERNAAADRLRREDNARNDDSPY